MENDHPDTPSRCGHCGKNLKVMRDTAIVRDESGNPFCSQACLAAAGAVAAKAKARRK